MDGARGRGCARSLLCQLMEPPAHDLGVAFSPEVLPLCRAPECCPSCWGLPRCGPHSVGVQGSTCSYGWPRFLLCRLDHESLRGDCSMAARSETTLWDLRMASKGQGRGKGVVCLGLKASDLTCPMIAGDIEAQGPRQVMEVPGPMTSQGHLMPSAPL